MVFVASEANYSPSVLPLTPAILLMFARLTAVLTRPGLDAFPRVMLVRVRRLAHTELSIHINRRILLNPLETRAVLVLQRLRAQSLT